MSLHISCLSFYFKNLRLVTLSLLDCLKLSLNAFHFKTPSNFIHLCSSSSPVICISLSFQPVKLSLTLTILVVCFCRTVETYGQVVATISTSPLIPIHCQLEFLKMLFCLICVFKSFSRQCKLLSFNSQKYLKNRPKGLFHLLFHHCFLLFLILFLLIHLRLFITNTSFYH